MVVLELILDCLCSDGCDQRIWRKVRHVWMFVRSFDRIFKLVEKRTRNLQLRFAVALGKPERCEASLPASLSLTLTYAVLRDTQLIPPYTHNTSLHCLSKAIMTWAATRAVVVVVAALMAASMLDVASASCANPSPVVLAYTAASGTTCGVGKLVGLPVWLRLLVVVLL